MPMSDVLVLTKHYRKHREVEHRLQMIRDAQTHDLPKTDKGFARLAAFIGVEDAALRSDLHERLEEVHTLTEGFFVPTVTAPVSGFGKSITARWLTYPALRSDRAVAIFDRVKPLCSKPALTSTRWRACSPHTQPRNRASAHLFFHHGVAFRECCDCSCWLCTLRNCVASNSFRMPQARRGSGRRRDGVCAGGRTPPSRRPAA